jgi:ribosome silencing factor RsfS/YbeB/iojap
VRLDDGRDHGYHEGCRSHTGGNIDTLKLARLVASAAYDKKAEDLAVLDLEGKTSYCDLVVLCTGASGRHVKAIAEHVRENLKEHGIGAIGMEGMELGRWVLLDLGAVVLHCFDGPLRGHYDLDGLWADARRISLEDLGLEVEGIEAPIHRRVHTQAS